MFEVNSWALSLMAPATPATEDSSGREPVPAVVGDVIRLVSGPRCCSEPPKPRLVAPAMMYLHCDGTKICGEPGDKGATYVPSPVGDAPLTWSCVYTSFRNARPSSSAPDGD